MQEFSPIEYVAIDIANNKGLDKLSWNERIQWVKDNLDNLENLEPEGKDKFLYRKGVRALRDAQKGIPTGFIMGLDSTNSGAQLISILDKSYKSASTCNVVNTGRREDLYGSIMEDIKIKGISRQDVKEAVIPMLYGSKAKPKELFGENTPELHAFITAVNNKLPSLYSISRLLWDCWNPTAKYHTFTLPDGHNVILPTEEIEESRIEADELGTRITYRYKVVTTSSNPTSIFANVVHAIDGYIVREMVRRAYKQGFQLATIHDSFWTSPKYMNQVRRNYLDILVELAKSNILEDIMYQLTGEKVQLIYDDPELYNEISESEYALS